MWTAEDVHRRANAMTPSLKLLRAEAAEIADKANLEQVNSAFANVEDLIWDAV